MNEEDAKSIVLSAWEARHYLGKDYVVDITLSTNDDPCSYDIYIRIEKENKAVFTHSWQTGDTVESFLNGFNARLNSIFELEA